MALFYANRSKEIHASKGYTLASPAALVEKTPVNAVAASGVVTFSGLPAVHVDNVQASGTVTITGTPVAEETLTVDDQEFTFEAERSGTGEITIDADNETQAENIVAAITADLTTVTAENTLGVVTITAVVAGTAGNAIVLTESATGTAVSGSGTLENGVDDVTETVTVGTQVFTFVTARATAGEVTVGSDASDTGDNLVTAMTADITNAVGVNDGGAVTVTAAVKGTSGNLIVLAEDAANTAVSSVTGGKLDGGINGTEGVANEICADASYIYHCIATNTVVDTNWRQISLGSAY
jgi:hypothetical protein